MSPARWQSPPRTTPAPPDDGLLPPPRTPSAGERRNCLYDGRGSVVGLAGPYGFPETYYTYEPHGRAQRSKGPDHNPFGYLGAYAAPVKDRAPPPAGPTSSAAWPTTPRTARLLVALRDDA